MQTRRVAYDPTIYLGAAPHYAVGRPPYSRELVPMLAEALGLDGAGRLLDVGCGPGILTVELAGAFDRAVGLDPDPDMLAEGARRASAAAIDNVTWVQALAEDIPTLGLGTFRVVTFGQSFQWTDRERVAESIFDLLDPDGAAVFVTHAHDGRPQPEGPGHPPIPHELLRDLIARELGSTTRAGQGTRVAPTDRYEDALERTRFGRPTPIYAPGRDDIVRDVDGVISGYLSMSYAAPHLFGDRLDAFVADARAALAAASPTGLFWDWPGDTELLIARKPG
jgi:SAM-dependent methyltransferase